MEFKEHLHNIKNIFTEFSESRARIQEIKKVHDFGTLRKAMISVRNQAFSPFIRLHTPGELGVWNKTAFVSVVDPDINFIINKPNPYVTLKKDISRNWTIHMEPPGYIRKLGMDSPRLLEKFGKVFTSDPRLFEKGGKFIASPPFVHWHHAINSYARDRNTAVYNFDFLKGIQTPPTKKTSLVAINSRINDLPGHKLRADFIARISESNMDYDLYGSNNWSIYKQYRGNALEGKWPVYSPARYVLAIENEVSDYYWTEKFTDAILCFCIPIYHGSPKISQYFPEGSYIPLDITKKSAVDDLRAILASDFYERNVHNLIKARNLVLTEHNLFNFINKELQKLS